MKGKKKKQKELKRNGKMKDKDKAIKLAYQHWDWVKGFIDSLAEDARYSESTLQYIYVTAFIHGWKHAKEEVQDGV